MHHRIPITGISRGIFSSSSSSSLAHYAPYSFSVATFSSSSSYGNNDEGTPRRRRKSLNRDNCPSSASLRTTSLRQHSTASSVQSTYIHDNTEGSKEDERSVSSSSFSSPLSSSSSALNEDILPTTTIKSNSKRTLSSNLKPNMERQHNSRNGTNVNSSTSSTGTSKYLPWETADYQRFSSFSASSSSSTLSSFTLSALEAEVQSLYSTASGKGSAKITLPNVNASSSLGSNPSSSYYDTTRQSVQLWGSYQRHPEVSSTGNHGNSTTEASFLAAAIASYVHRGAFRLAVELYLSRANQSLPSTVSFRSRTLSPSSSSSLLLSSSSYPSPSSSLSTHSPSYVVDRRTYSLLIKAASRIGNPDMLEKILEDAVWYGNIEEKVYLDRLFTTCLQVPVPDIARALGILKRMFLLGSRLTHNVYRQVVKYAYSTKQSERMIYALRELVYKRKQLEQQQNISDLDTKEVQQTVQDLETRIDMEEFDNNDTGTYPSRSSTSTARIENQLRKLSSDATHLQKLTNTELKEALPFDTEQLALPILHFCLENANGSAATVAYYSYRTLLLSASPTLHFTTEVQNLYTSILYHGARTGTPTLIEIALTDIMTYFRQMEMSALSASSILSSAADNASSSVSSILEQRRVWLNDSLHALLVAYATTGDSVGAMRTMCLIIHEGFTLRSTAWDTTVRCLQKASSNFHQWESILRSSSEQQQQQQATAAEESATNVSPDTDQLPSSADSIVLRTDDTLPTDTTTNAELSSLSQSENEDGELSSSSSSGLNDNDFSGSESNRGSDGDSSDASGEDGIVSSLSSSFHRSVNASTIAFLHQRPSASSYVLPSTKSEYALLASLLGTYPQMFNGELPNNYPIEDTHISLPFPNEESSKKLLALQNLAKVNAPSPAPRNNDGTVSAEALRRERPEALAALAAGYGAASYLGRLSFLGMAEAHALTTSNGGWLSVLQNVTEQLDTYLFGTRDNNTNGSDNLNSSTHTLDLSQVPKYSLSSILSQQHGGVAVQLPEGNFRMFATISQTLGLPANTYGPEPARLARTEGRFPTIPPAALAACISSFVMNRGTRRQALVLAEFAFRALEVTPDADVYAAILSNYSHERRDKLDLPTAQEIVRKMVSNNITPNARMYTELVTLWLRAKRINKAYDTLVQSIQVKAAPSLEIFEVTARAAMKLITGKGRKDSSSSGSVKTGRTENGGSSNESIAEMGSTNKETRTENIDDVEGTNMVSPITILDLAEQAGYKVSERLREILLLELHPENRSSSSSSPSSGGTTRPSLSRFPNNSSQDRSNSSNHKGDRSTSKMNRSKSVTKNSEVPGSDAVAKSAVTNDTVPESWTKSLPKEENDTVPTTRPVNVNRNDTSVDMQPNDPKIFTAASAIVPSKVNRSEEVRDTVVAASNGTEATTTVTVPSFPALPSMDGTSTDPAARLRAFAAATLRHNTDPNNPPSKQPLSPTNVDTAKTKGPNTNTNTGKGTFKSPVVPKKIIVPSVPPVTENYEPVLSLLDKTVNSMVQKMDNPVATPSTVGTNAYPKHPLASTVIGSTVGATVPNK